MDLNVSRHDDYVVARLGGNLDESARDPFREHLHPLFATKGTNLIVDLSDSPRINSAGIGNLVALVADANTNDSRVIVCNLQPYVSMVISVTKLDKFFEIAASVDEAIASAREPRKRAAD
jgi:anti-sigma B factor antagonist